MESDIKQFPLLCILNKQPISFLYLDGLFIYLKQLQFYWNIF